MNSCPYRANSFFHHRPLFVDSIGATTILTRGAVAKEYVRTSDTLLLLSPELIFVDPYLYPCEKRYRDVIEGMFAAAAKGKCQKITCWARESAVIGRSGSDLSSTLDDIKAVLSNILTIAERPKSKKLSVRYILVDDGASQTKMHSRFVLSIKGGIRYDQGFHTLTGRRRVEVSPVGGRLHDEYLKIYHEGEHDMQVEGEFRIQL